MARTDPQVNFRLPQELKDRLEQSAKENGRSVTSELVIRLEQSYHPKSVNVVNINIKDYLSEQAIKVFDEEFEQIRQKLRNKFKDVSQDDLDKFLAHLLEQ